MFIPLKITTDYSLLKSLIKVSDIVSFARDKKIKILGICDDTLFGVQEFLTKCLAEKIKPIIGLEINIDDNQLYIYAKNYFGYQKLLKLNTKKQIEKIKIEELDHEDLIVVVPYNEIESFEIKANYYISYTTFLEKNNALLITKNIVFMPNIKLMNSEDSDYLNYLTAIDLQKSYKDIAEYNYEKNAYLYYQNLEDEDHEMILNFANLIEIIFPTNQNYMPVYKEKQNSKDLLFALCKRGLDKRLQGKTSKEYQDRLLYELNVIIEMGFTDYFLIVYDYVLYAKKNNILVGPGRGSAAGSLVSYALGITEIDPLYYNLVFERFLNKERITMPDIDIDFDANKREQIIEYIKERYGRYSVANIMTYGTLTSKLAFIQMAKAQNISEQLSSLVSKIIDPKLSLKNNLENPNIKTILNKNDSLKKAYIASLKIEGLKKYIGTHAAGVVISNIPLDEIIPIYHNGTDMLTGFTMNYLEDLGLLKMDLLAIRNLTIIQNILDLIKKNTNESINLNQIDLNDKNVLKLFENGDTVGIFQFESVGMKNFLKKLKPETLEMLIAALALYRPGPMQYIDEFILRKDKKKEVKYLHPDLEPILKETYGIMIYQEQIMQVLVKIGGYKYSSADNIRRAMSKKKKDVIDAEKETFIKRAIDLGYEKTLATQIFEDIEKFANYGFNKAHSVSYALIAYQMAYLKVKYPIYYITNLLNMCIGSETKTSEYFNELKKYDYKLKKADINQSDLYYKIEEEYLLVPLTTIKNLGNEACQTIIEERKKGNYKDYMEFVSRVYGKSVNKKTLEALIDAGALDSFNENHNTLKHNMDIAINYANLIADLDESLVMKPMIERVEDDLLESRIKEYNAYGFYITNHPSSQYPNLKKLENLKEYFDKQIEVVVLIETIRSIKTKKNQDMAFITASDETNLAEFVVFPESYMQLMNLKKQDLVRIIGKVTKRLDQYQIVIYKIRKEVSS